MADNIAPVMELDELEIIFGYKNRLALNHAIRVGRFPVPTFIMADRRVAHVDVVQEYFARQKREGMEALDPWDAG